MIDYKTDKPVTAHMTEDWEAGQVGVTVEFEHPEERRRAWVQVATVALLTAAMDEAMLTAEKCDRDLDDPAERLTFAEVRAIRDCEAAFAALRLAADLAAAAGYLDAARQVRKVMKEVNW